MEDMPLESIRETVISFGIELQRNQFTMLLLFVSPNRRQSQSTRQVYEYYSVGKCFGFLHFKTVRISFDSSTALLKIPPWQCHTQGGGGGGQRGRLHVNKGT